MTKDKRSALIMLLCSIGIFAILALVNFVFWGQSRIERDYGHSEQYTKKEIREAMDVVMKSFNTKFKGCKMTKIYYDEKYDLSYEGEWKDEHKESGTIILLSNFDVDSSGGDGSLNPNETYEKWNWLLHRNDKGKWVLDDWGY